MAERGEWRKISWRQGTKGALSALFAVARVRYAEGETGAGGRRMPGAEAWLIGEERPGGERRWRASNLPPSASARELAALVKSRWSREQAHEQMKNELGLDHFEGRSWRGLHRHAPMVQIAHLFLRRLRLKGKKGGRGRSAGRRRARRCRPSAARWPP